MYPRLFVPPKSKSFFLFGPRGTGKSSLIRTLYPAARVFDLLDDSYYRSFLAAPERLEAQLDGHPKSTPIVLDEVQRVPALLNHVHRLIEAKGFTFIMTGSSARKLRAKGVNLLAGRALTRNFFPLTAKELGSDFNLKTSLLQGHLPAVFAESQPNEFLQSYVSTYLREEVLQEGLTRNIAAFSRFLEAASFAQAGILSISSVGRECAIERKVVESYFEILEDLLIAFRLPVFSKKAKRKLIKQQKFYFFDCGVFRAIRPRGPLDSPDEIAGPSLETLVVQEVRALNDLLGLGYQLSFWHTADHKHEVDLVCYGPRGLKAFEVKRSSRVRTEDLKGLTEFRSDYPTAETVLIYGGEREYTESGVRIIPADAAIRNLEALL